MDTEKLVIGKTIKIPAMRRGLVKYPDETILVNQGALEKLAKTSYGIPVVIEHPGIKINRETIKSIPIHGRVADMHYDTDTDEWSVHFVVDTQEAVDCLNSGWGVSTAWIGENYGPSGTYNAMPYNRELLEGKYEHLAIVQDPRYEMAKGPIFYNSKNSLKDENKKDSINANSQKSGGKEMLFKLFRMVREEIKTNENEQFMLNIAGNEVPLTNVLEEMKTMEAKKNEEEKKKKEGENKAKTLNGEDMVEHNGEKISVNELVKRYNEMKQNAEETPEEKKKKEDEAKKNADEETKKKEDEAKKNADEETKKKEDEAKQNALKEDEKKRFNALKDTHDNASNEVNAEEFVTQAERMKAGSERYGSKT